MVVPWSPDRRLLDRLALGAGALAAGLSFDLASKALLGPVTYDGFVVTPFLPQPLWLGLAALVALRLPSPALSTASAAILAGIAGNAIDPRGSIDAGAFGAWNVADGLIVAGLGAMIVWLTVWFAAAANRRQQRIS